MRYVDSDKYQSVFLQAKNGDWSTKNTKGTKICKDRTYEKSFQQGLNRGFEPYGKPAKRFAHAKTVQPAVTRLGRFCVSPKRDVE